MNKVKHDLICSVTVTYNPDNALIEQLEILKDCVDQMLIVDNGSLNISYIEDIKMKYKPCNLEVISNKKNLGIAAALNIGAKYALENGFRWILTMDQDSIPTKDMIKKMVDLYYSLSEKEREIIMGIFPKYIEKTFYNEKDFQIENGWEYVITGITSGNLLKCIAFDKIGYFDEKLFIDYVDNEFFLRAGIKGYKFIECKSAVLLHSLGNQDKRRFFNRQIICTNHSHIRRYYITRNRLYFYKKFFKMYPAFILKDFIALLKETAKIILFEKQKYLKIKMTLKGIIDFIRGKYGPLN